MISSTGLRDLSDLDSAGLYELILETSEIITYTPCISKVYEKFALALQKLVEFDRVNITFFDDAAGTVTVYYHYGQEIPERLPGQTRPLAGTRAQQVLETGQTVIEEDITSSPGISIASVAALRSGLRSSIAVPLFSRGKVMGALSLRSRKPRAYGLREKAILEQLTRLIAPAVERDRLTMQVSLLGPYTTNGASTTSASNSDWADDNHHQSEQSSVPDYVLSPRELCVLRHIVQGSSNDEIAFFLKVSRNTVKTHVRHILRKLKVSNRFQAALAVGRELEAER